jgi:hypothetical protein
VMLLLAASKLSIVGFWAMRAWLKIAVKIVKLHSL